ncbi:TIM-barrel domain-containing protein [Aquimarina addita]|uniref:TIM-barrel domain-containing protein n=1 Tax=Aquimarina addita TaxID=870485 RepID=UPI0031EE2CC8
MNIAPHTKGTMFSCILLILCTVFNTLGQQNIRSYKSFKKYDTHTEISVSDGIYLIRPLTNKIIETQFLPTGEKKEHQSHIEQKEFQPLAIVLTETKNQLKLNTKGIRAVIQKQPFQIQYYFKDRFLISEKNGFQQVEEMQRIDFTVTTDEVFYGGGARALPMNRRGYKLPMYNKAHYGYETEATLLNYTIPIILSSHKYLLHFDTAQKGILDIDSTQDNTIFYEAIGGVGTYQVVAGNSWETILQSYTAITGRQEMPPMWAFGNFASRFGYHTQQEVEAIVQQFQEDEIPLDAVVLDIFWFGKNIKGHMGNLAFDTEAFPSPFHMIETFKKQGIKTVLVTEPFVLTTSKRWQDALEQKVLATDTLGVPYIFDFYFGNTGLIDIFKPDAKAWFWNIYKDLTQKGVAGWWCDLGEPEVHPSDLTHVNGMADEVHNIYGHEWAKMLYNGYQNSFPEQRIFNLMRSGYSGSQRYGSIPWSGDVNRSWGGLQAQPKIALQMGMQGLGYMHSDLGGFAGGETFDPQLYIRWLQYGVFQPIFRPHGQEHIASEPIYHSEITKRLAKKSIDLRYSLLPYNYTLAFINTQTGMPLMRPLLFEENTVPAQTHHEGYFWGTNFWIHPVLHPNRQKESVYLPKGNSWYSFTNDVLYEGGKWHDISIEKDHIPVFVKSGSFIPRVSNLATTENYDLSTLQLHYYMSDTLAQNTEMLYFDDGKLSKAYQNGNYQKLFFNSKRKSNQLYIDITKEVGDFFESLATQLQLIIHGFDKKINTINMSGKQLDYHQQISKKTIRLHLTIEATEVSKHIKIEF